MRIRSTAVGNYQKGAVPSTGHAQNRLNDCSRLGVCECLLDLVQLIIPHELVKRETALLEELDECWDELSRASSASQYANYPLAPESLKVIERKTRIGGCATDEDERSQHPDRIGQLLDDRDNPCTVKGEVHR